MADKSYLMMGFGREQDEVFTRIFVFFAVFGAVKTPWNSYPQMRSPKNVGPGQGGPASVQAGPLRIPKIDHS